MVFRRVAVAVTAGIVLMAAALPAAAAPSSPASGAGQSERTTTGSGSTGSTATTGRQATAAVARKPKPSKVRITPPPRRVGLIRPGDFGMHSYQGKPEVAAGSYRHNCYPLWRDMNPAPGVYDWDEADRIIDEAQAMGYRDSMFSFCGTPEWAAKKPVKNPAREYWGEYSTAAPKDMADWRTFLRAFVERYSTRLTGYEAWNEATAQYLWQGTPDEMAEMTKILYEVVREQDPTGKVISANSQMGEQPAWFRSFFPKYMRGLAARNWPVDVVSIHSYAGHPSKIAPAEGIVKRLGSLQELTRAAAAAKIPSRIQLWDTETNYLGKADPRLQQALVLRTYLDSWRYGLKRTYWYMWVAKVYPWLGVQMMVGAPGVAAYDTLVAWTVGAQFRGCGKFGKAEICEFRRGTERFRIGWTPGYTDKQKFVLGQPTSVCPPSGAACQTRRQVTLNYSPVKIG